MTTPRAESHLVVAVIALVMLFDATTTVAQVGERIWTVNCGLPQEDGSILESLPTGGYTGPWPGDPRSGDLEAKTLNRPNPHGSMFTEMWLLSRGVGWWRLKAMWVHPDDASRLSEFMELILQDDLEPLSAASRLKIRQIIDSPFLSKPVTVRAGNPEDEELVDGQIFALLPDASQLRCDPQPEGQN